MHMIKTLHNGDQYNLLENTYFTEYLKVIKYIYSLFQRNDKENNLFTFQDPVIFFFFVINTYYTKLFSEYLEYFQFDIIYWNKHILFFIL